MRPVAVLLLLLLAGCAVPAPQVTSAACPSVDIYSPAENRALASELAVLPESDVLRKVANEDHRLRTELVACRSAVTP